MANKFNLDGFSVDENNVCTASGGFVGALTGPVSSSVLSTFTNLTASQLQSKYIALTVTDYSEDATIAASFANLDASSATTDMTIAAPAAGQILVIRCEDATFSCTVTLTAGTFDGTNDVATFDAADETLVLIGISATRFVIVENIGGVTFSQAA